MYVRQALDLLEGLIATGDESKQINVSHLQKLIVFAIMWSLGALLELEDKKKVSVPYVCTTHVRCLNVVFNSKTSIYAQFEYE